MFRYVQPRTIVVTKGLTKMPYQYEQLTEYAAQITDKYHDGRIDEAKYERLMDKLGEWVTQAQREVTLQ